MRGGMGRRVSASIRSGYLGGKARARVFNLNLQIKIEGGDTVSGWQGENGARAAPHPPPQPPRPRGRRLRNERGRRGGGKRIGRKYVFGLK